MPFTADQKQHVASVLEKKMINPCPICGQRKWLLVDGIADITIRSDPKLPSLTATKQSLPSVAVICKTCGNTVLFNVFYLELDEYFGIKAAGGDNA